MFTTQASSETAVILTTKCIIKAVMDMCNILWLIVMWRTRYNLLKLYWVLKVCKVSKSIVIRRWTM